MSWVMRVKCGCPVHWARFLALPVKKLSSTVTYIVEVWDREAEGETDMAKERVES